ncbi:hypothetical protein Dimus_002285 [Dionaea muscipula]
MEEKRRETGSQPPATSSPKQGDSSAGDPVVSRRRGGALKRKFNSSTTSLSSSTPFKRQAREKLNSTLASAHNGPLTRARQLSDNSTSSAAFSTVKDEIPLAASQQDTASGASAAEVSLDKEELEALEAAIEAEFEAIRSRDVNVHVVPVHAGWFSWTKVHTIEERSLPSFFNGKCQSRTQEVYMEIRNWIIKKFRSNPNINFESKDLLDLPVAELDAREEVMEFLDHWGLINYHPFPLKVAANANPNINTFLDKTDAADSLIRKLYQFETEQLCPQLVPRGNLSAPTVPARLFPESSVTEELAKQEGPEVEYHCNSCTADCSRKRYHCQKQADFDLCPECYNDGKFGSGMSPSDFILMEPAEASGAGGGTWTDQETLLLLEALELYKENWNEIAEHVATKTKAQCILHFLQMPIEDSFMESHGKVNNSLHEDVIPRSSNDNASLPMDVSEASESKTVGAEVPSGSSPLETSKLEDSPDGKLCEGAGESIALNILREAFETVGSSLASEHNLSFAEAGNPVMALAVFLMRLVEPGVVTASARSSLKLIHGCSSGMLLAARHCFPLEDDEDDKKEQIDSDSPDAEKVDLSTQEERVEENLKEKNPNEVYSTGQDEQKSTQTLDGNGLKSENMNGWKKDSAPDENLPVIPGPPENECMNKSEAFKEPEEVTQGVGSRVVDVLQNSVQPPSDMEDINNSPTKVKLPLGSGKEEIDAASAAKSSERSEAGKDVDMESVPTLPDTEEQQEPAALDGANTGEDKSEDAKTEDLNHAEGKQEDRDDHNIDKLRRAAIATIAAAVVKAKLLAENEEDDIKQLASVVIDKQLRKLELKMTFFSEMENAIMRVKEHLDRSRQKLYQERAQIIASRLGLPASSSRLIAPSLSANRMPASFTNSMPRPPIQLNMTAQRPPISKPAMASAPPSSGLIVPSVVAGPTSMPPSSK